MNAAASATVVDTSPRLCRPSASTAALCDSAAALSSRAATTASTSELMATTRSASRLCATATPWTCVACSGSSASWLWACPWSLTASPGGVGALRRGAQRGQHVGGVAGQVLGDAQALQPVAGGDQLDLVQSQVGPGCVLRGVAVEPLAPPLTKGAG